MLALTDRLTTIVLCCFTSILYETLLIIHSSIVHSPLSFWYLRPADKLRVKEIDESKKQCTVSLGRQTGRSYPQILLFRSSLHLNGLIERKVIYHNETIGNAHSFLNGET